MDNMSIAIQAMSAKDYRIRELLEERDKLRTHLMSMRDTFIPSMRFEWEGPM